MRIWNRRARSVSGADAESNAEVARLLRPSETQSEAHRAAVLSRLQRSMSGTVTREDAGTLDGTERPAGGVQEVAHPEVGTVLLSDIEPLDPERMLRVTEQIAELMQDQKQDGGR